MEALSCLPPMTSSSDKDPSHDPLADLDDDLGDDWESAFQAEEFMFSPEDESSDFFLLDENGADSSEDIAHLITNQEGQKENKTGKDTTTGSAEPSAILEFPTTLQILAAYLPQFFQSRPLYQRLLIGSLPFVLILIIASTLFFRSTTDELASRDDKNMVSAPSHGVALAPQGQGRVSSAPQQKQAPALSPAAVPAVKAETIQHKWQLPTFIIVADGDNHSALIINIDLTLIAHLEKGQNLPADKQIFAQDIIYQFFTNRPAYELKRFALARGEMISQLNAWLSKQWLNNPFDTITFSRYQVIHTPPSITPPPLAPKVTFM